ncbi:MAG: 50S ribosomal protein L29 [Metamycoplasmataceae bacterium]
MQYSELIKKSKKELEDIINEYRAELFLLRFKNKTGQLDQSHKIKLIRKDIAKTLTAMKELELNINKTPKKETKQKGDK